MWRFDRALPYVLSSLALIAFGCGGGGQTNVPDTGSATFDGVFPSAACVRRTCASTNATCGFIADGCGDFIACGGAGVVNTGCPDQTSCGGSTPNQCSPGACTPAGSCGPKSCGAISDGCADVIFCGECAFPEVCGATVPNECGTPSLTPMTLSGEATVLNDFHSFDLFASVTLSRSDRENTFSVNFFSLEPGEKTGVNLQDIDMDMAQDGPDRVWDSSPQGTIDWVTKEVECSEGGFCLLDVTMTLHVTSSPVFVGDITITAGEMWVDVEESGCGGGGCSTSFPIPSK